MRYRILSLVLATIAGVVAIESFKNTAIYGMMSLIVPQWLPYAVIAIPVLGFIAGRSIFSTTYYLALMVLAVVPSIQESEVFEGVVDAVYSLGYESAARTILELFPYQDSFSVIALITMLCILGIYSENLDVYESKLRDEGYSFSLAPTLAFLVLILAAVYGNLERIYPLILVEADFLYAIVALIAFSLSLLALWRMR